MNFLKIDECSINNGVGCRVVLWVSGCNHYCKGCQNPQTWDCNSGKELTNEFKDYLFSLLEKPYINGITFSGGDPLNPNNNFEIRKLSNSIKKAFPDKTQWLYSGYTWNEIYENEELLKTLENIDVLVDGKYIEEERDITLPWRGSRNQKVIDVKATKEWYDSAKTEVEMKIRKEKGVIEWK
jgi:anaerobic ribonucleoside-triphosphate reductase activating protein